MRTLRHRIFGHSGVDAVLGTISPFEVWNGGGGDDVHTGTAQDDTLNGNGGNDTLNGGDGSDLIDGGEGNDILAGDAGDDVLKGGIGDDTITSTAGADTVDGGDGTDTWIGSYASATGALTFDQRTGTLSNGTTLTGIEVIQLTTGSGADQLTMNGDQAFTIDGGAGIDTFIFDPTGGSRAAAPLIVTVGIASGALNTTLQDGALINAANRFERLAITGSSADDQFTIGTGKFDATPSTVMLDGGDGNDRLTWNMYNLALTNFIVREDGTVDCNLATLSGFESFDLTFSRADTVVLGAGDDKVFSYYGGMIDGGAGDDDIDVYRDAVGQIHGGSGDDKLSSSSDDVLIFGDDGDDTISAYSRNTDIDGGSGYDTFSYSFGRSTTYDQATNKFSNGMRLVDIERVSITTAYTGRGSGIYLNQASDVRIVSRNHKDGISINLTGVETGVTFVASTDENKDSHISFGMTNITAYHQGGAFQGVYFVGTSGDDVVSIEDLKTNMLLPSLDGGAGFDTLGVHLEPDGSFIVTDSGTIISSSGHYTNFERFDITVHDGDNTVVLGAADDTITVVDYAVGANDLSAGAGNDVITGALGADILRGGDGDDRLTGSDGDDLLNGGLGDDIIDGGAGIDTVGYDGATSGVTVSLLKSGAQNTKGAGTDTLSGIENLYGSDFNDKLTGDASANTLRGRDGDDVLRSGAGNDRLEGGPGADRMTGGKGADIFAFMRLTDISTGAHDQILDFKHTDGDKIELSNIDLSKDPGDQQFTFIGTAAFTGADDIYELRVEDAGKGVFLVQGDVNHDGVADFTFDVKTDAPLVATDFLL